MKMISKVLGVRAHRIRNVRANVDQRALRTCSGSRVQGSGFRVQGAGCRVQGSVIAL